MSFIRFTCRFRALCFVIMALSSMYLLPAAASDSATYGDVRVPIGSNGMVSTIPLDAGGADDSSQIVAGCIGFINSDRPDLTITLEGIFPDLVVSVRSDADTTLFVRTPDGSVFCDDDTDGLNPVIRLPKAAAGRYDVWVGVFEPVFASAEVDVSVGVRGATGAAALSPFLSPVPESVIVDRRLDVDVTPDSVAFPIIAQLVEFLDAAQVRISAQFEQDIYLSTSSAVVRDEGGSGFLLELKGLTLTHDNGLVSFGDVLVGFSAPEAEVLYWSIDELPQVTFIAGGETAGRINFDFARLAGRYDTILKTHLGYDIDLRNISFLEASGSSFSEVRRVRFSTDLGKEPSGTLGGAMLLELRGVKVDDENGGVSIGRIGLETRVRSLDLAALDGTNYADLADPEKWASAGLEAASIILGSGIGSSDTQIFIENLRTRLPDRGPFRLGGLGLQIGYDAGGELSEIRIGASMEDLDVDDPQIPSALRSGSVAIQLGLENLPLIGMVSAMSGLDPMDTAQQAQIAEILLSALLRANPALRLDAFSIDMNELVLSSVGRLQMSSSMVPVGNLEIVVRGLSKLMDDARAGTGGMIDEDLLPLLEFAQSIGFADGNPVEGRLKYSINVTPDMKILVNGIDISKME